MNICTWNVRGMNDPNKIGEIRRFINNNNIAVFALLETKVKEQNSQKAEVWNGLALGE